METSINSEPTVPARGGIYGILRRTKLGKLMTSTKLHQTDIRKRDLMDYELPEDCVKYLIWIDQIENSNGAKYEAVPYRML